MTTLEQRTVIAEVSDRLVELYVKRDEACIEADFERALSLQREIEAVSEKRRQMISSVE